MKLVVGLGNPGRRYASTRHNAGFRIVDRFAERHGLTLSSAKFGGRFGRGRALGLDVGLLQPDTYMNLSGQSVAEALRFLPLEDPSCDLLIALDDVDLPFGRLRLRPAGGSGGHKGLQDVIDCLGSRELPRLRFGVGRPASATAAAAVDTTDYVLEPFSKREEAALPAQIDVASDAIEVFLVDGIDAAMNRYNRDPDAAEPS